MTAAAIAVDVASALRDLLAGGPIDGRDALALLAAQGCTAKQVRTARERMGVRVVRSGSGAAMRSTWALAPGTTATNLISAERADQIQKVDEVCHLKMEAAEFVDLTAAETSRVDRRVQGFMALGIDPVSSADLARRLVVDRDRIGSREGSCAECQCLRGSSCGPGTAGFTSGPRPLSEVWMCWTARRQ